MKFKLVCGLTLLLAASSMGQIISGGIYNTVFIPPSSGATCTPGVLSQDWESGSLPSGWSTFQGSPTYNFTPALLGSFSLGLANNATQPITRKTGLGGQTEVWGFCYFKTTAQNSSSNPSVIQLYDASVNDLFTWVIDTSGSTYIHDQAGGTGTFGGGVTLAANTLYYFWWHYKAGSGANSLVEASFSTTLSRPTSGTGYATLTGGTSTTGLDSVYLTGPNDTAAPTYVMDHFGLSSTCSFDTGW